MLHSGRLQVRDRKLDFFGARVLIGNKTQVAGIFTQAFLLGFRVGSQVARPRKAP